MRRIGLAIVVATLLLGTAVPAVASQSDDGWRSAIWDGNREPNVPLWDTDDVMWQDASQQAEDRIYFDMTVETLTFGDGPGIPNPNLEGTHFPPQATQSFYAFLGYWEDCNQDGFIGDEVFGLEYPAETLVGGQAGNCDTSTPYNNGNQIFEYLPIGPGTRDVSQDDQLCPNRQGDADNKPRTQSGEGILVGGDNVVCFGERQSYVQDDFAKVWYDIALPIDDPLTSSLIFPLPDGTFRDSNGHFKYVDSLTFGEASTVAPGLWPTEHGQAKNSDPAEGNQCNEGARSGEVTEVGAIASSTVQGATDPTCSPVPNVRQATLPTLGAVAYPGHLAEDRLNSSEGTSDHPTPITAPYTHEDHPDNDEEGAHRCELKTENGADDWDDDPSDGDPFYGGDLTGSTISFARSYYGTSDGGPSIAGTLSNVLGGTLYTVATVQEGQENADCSKGEPVGPIEFHGDAGQGPGLKTASDAVMGFVFEDNTFNPSTAPGDPTGSGVADREVCTNTDEAIERATARCTAHWQSATQWIQGHGANELDPYGSTKDVVSTAYADVSFGEDTFDPAGDGPFRVGQGYYEAPAALSGAGATPSPLPGGDDGHTYGDEQCDSYTTLSGANNDGDDISPVDHITAVDNDWSCDRNQWVQANQVDCLNDEVTCWTVPKIGDPYDLRDVECQDNDVMGHDTTDEDGPVGQAKEELGQDLELSIDDPNRSCQQLPPPPS